ncbi:hypothetical protein ACIAD0060 [Acinetobacter baylyi ADP1]|uniref:Uncharacterized protein n=1 Tax=Acinetobacter baylyi (strain ATCC 33305 / BD413 / ADP1) TaxID=62977 RepID=Q6FFW5_ACIAD|nr:hypothetical protein ACIAD0060 [Acinetobacter baylyi ADP1]
MITDIHGHPVTILQIVSQTITFCIEAHTQPAQVCHFCQLRC